jgi:PBS lyase HEAT-like repeat
MWKLILRSACGVALLVLSGVPALAQTAKTPTEAELIKVLKSSSSMKEKADACRQLATVGTRAAVPVLAELLANEKLAHMARYALEPIPDPSVDEALRAALGKLKGRLLVGVIGSIGVRRDGQATDGLARRLADPDPSVAQAAARALGRIATPEAVRSLMHTLAMNVTAANEPALYEGLFRCAETLAADGSREEALAIYDVLRAGKAPLQIGAAALRGAIIMRKGKDRLELLREQLRTEDRALFAAAVCTAQEIPEPDVASLLMADIKETSAPRKALLVQALVCVADKCLRGKDAASAAGRLLGPLQQAAELAPTTELKEQTTSLLQMARKGSTNTVAGSGPGPFLEVGKTYWFMPATGPDGGWGTGKWGNIQGKVLDVRGDSWVRILVKEATFLTQPQEPIWLNLNHIMFVGDNPMWGKNPPPRP